MVIFLEHWPAISAHGTMEVIFSFPSSTHLAIILSLGQSYAVKDIIDFRRQIFIKFTLQAGVLAKGHLAFRVLAFDRWLLYFLAFQAFYFLYFAELHPLHFAGFRLWPLVLFIVANFASIEYSTAGSLNQAISTIMLATISQICHDLLYFFHTYFFLFLMFLLLFIIIAIFPVSLIVRLN